LPSGVEWGVKGDSLFVHLVEDAGIETLQVSAASGSAWVTHSHLSNLQLGKQTLAIKFTLGVVAGELSK
jgi:hypothetical protein